MKYGVGAIIENDEGDLLVVKEKETKEQYSKYQGDLSIPFGTVGDNIKNENLIDALYREVLEETGLNLSENKYLPCELFDFYLANLEGNILFKVRIFHIKLNGVLKKYEEKVLNNEIENSFFISKNEFKNKIEEKKIRAGADFVFEKNETNLFLEGSYEFNEKMKRLLFENDINNPNIVIVGPGSKYEK